MEKGSELVRLIEALEEEAVNYLVRQRLEAGHNPMEIIREAEMGMRRVGQRYEEGQYYITGLIMAGEIFGQVVELAMPLVEEYFRGNFSGRVLLGTVKGDIHDLGKTIVSFMLRCQGFEVEDMGVDVPVIDIISRASEWRPDIVGLSGLLTVSFSSMKETVDQLRNEIRGWEKPPSVIIGGSQIDERICHYVGADFWSTDVVGGVAWCQKIVQNK
ncbi:MAG: cobalamin-dependent protein [Anaerolineales bacterium]|nr:cobalamin-dependent protein [Anaerolineales bacterium]